MWSHETPFFVLWKLRGIIKDIVANAFLCKVNLSSGQINSECEAGHISSSHWKLRRCSAAGKSDFDQF